MRKAWIFLSKESIVEVRINKQGFEGAWYKAKVLGSYPVDPTQKILVEYKSDSNQLLQESFDISFIRPLPPPPAADQTYKPNDVVDALCGNGWWKGVVSKVEVFEKKKKRYIVLLENPFQELAFSSSDLRVHLDWSHDGTWLLPPPPPKQEIINLEEEEEKDCGKQSEKLRKGPPPPPPSVLLIKSTEQVVDMTTLTQTEYSTGGDSRSNLPLNNRKNTSPNQQELGPDDKKDESSKKRGREMNAQVIGQKVAAAAEKDKTNENCSQVINGGNVQNLNQSSSSAVVNVKAESEEKNLPFVKRSYMWKEFDSQQVFKTLPQTPHFSNLWDYHEETREGLAIGHMLTFASLVEKVSNLQIQDPTSLFDKYLEALSILEEIGFDVKAVVDRVNDLLSLKTRQKLFHDESEKCQSLVVECDEKKAKLEAENTAIDKMIGELEAKRAANVSRIAKQVSTRDFLQLKASTIQDFTLDMKLKFEEMVLSGFSLRR